MSHFHQKNYSATRTPTPAPGRINNTHLSRKTPSPAPTPIPGLSELTIIVKTVKSTPAGQQAAIDPTTLEAVKASPLAGLFSELRSMFLRYSTAQAEAEAKSTWVRAPGTGHDRAVPRTKKRDDIVITNTTREDDRKATEQDLPARISSCQQDTVTTLTTHTQSNFQQLTIVEDQVQASPTTLKHDLTTLNTQVAELRAELQDANARTQKLERKNEALKRKLVDVRKDVDAASTALVPVMHALDCAVCGEFPTLKEAQASCVGLEKARMDVATLAAFIQEDTFKLMSSCQILFSTVQPATEPGSLGVAGSFKGNWASALESVQNLRAELMNSHHEADLNMREAEMHMHQLKLFGYLVDQVRNGQYQLDNWATNRPKYQDHMDGPFDGFDALHEVAEEMHRLRQANSRLRRQMSANGRTATRPGWSSLDSQSRR